MSMVQKNPVHEGQQLPVDAIHALDNDRTSFDDAELAGLAASIDQVGQLSPITVRPDPDGGFWLVTGERRFRAHRLLGRSTIWAVVKELDDAAAKREMLVENVQRTDLDPMDEARAYRERIDRFGGTPVTVAAEHGVNVARVKARLGLLNLTPDIQLLIVAKENGKGGLGVGMAQLMFGLDANRQTFALRALREHNLDWWELQDVCDRLRLEQDQDSLFADDLELVTEYATTAKTRRMGRKGLLALVATLVEALGELDADHPLVPMARAVILEAA